jgi:hypothetical protein
MGTGMYGITTSVDVLDIDRYPCQRLPDSSFMLLSSVGILYAGVTDEIFTS